MAEPSLRPGQFAYRRAKGADLHLATLAGFESRNLDRGKYVYETSLGIGGAYDAAPRNGLMGALWKAGADPHLVKFIEARMRGRRSRARLMAPEGRFISRARGVTRGFPQGGVLSPLLWILHYDRLFDLMEARAGRGGDGTEVESEAEYETVLLCLIYADDVVFAYVH